jgi:hypothetical protein
MELGFPFIIIITDKQATQAQPLQLFEFFLDAFEVRHTIKDERDRDRVRVETFKDRQTRPLATIHVLPLTVARRDRDAFRTAESSGSR